MSLKQILENVRDFRPRGRDRFAILGTAAVLALAVVWLVFLQQGLRPLDPGEPTRSAPAPAESGPEPLAMEGDAPGGAALPTEAAAEAGGAGEDVVGGVAAEPLPPAGPNVFPSEAAPLVPKPDSVKALYLNAWAAGSSRKMARMIEIAEQTEINAFVIDVKDATGYVSYETGVGIARQIGADRQRRIRDVRALLARLRERGIYPIARIVVFKDPLLAQRRPEWAIQKADGTIWRDQHDQLWVDSYNREIWEYNIALAREAVLLGFSEVQWDYVRFPDVPRRYMETAVFPAREGRTRAEAIREFLRRSRASLSGLGVLVTADVFGLTVSAGDDMGIGQRWDRMVDATDVLLPMVYPSHFARGSYGIPVPNAQPYETIRTAMEHAIRRSKGVENAAAIRPWLQDFTLGAPKYGPAEVRAQIQATYDAGLSEWVLWNPSGRYTIEALAPEGGEPPEFPIPRHDVERIAEPDEAELPTPRILLGEPVDSVRPPRDEMRRPPSVRPRPLPTDSLDRGDRRR